MPLKNNIAVAESLAYGAGHVGRVGETIYKIASSLFWSETLNEISVV